MTADHGKTKITDLRSVRSVKLPSVNGRRSKMKAMLKVKRNKEAYGNEIKSLWETIRQDYESHEPDGPCFCIRCRAGAGWGEMDDDGVFRYQTGSGLGRYEFFSEEILFEGRRNSFKDGTEFFHPRDFEKYGFWEVTESLEPERGVWD